MDFELVSKYRNKLTFYARKYNVSPEDVFQEARIIEWRLNKFSPANKISYFLNSCQHQTLKLAHFGVASLEELDMVESLVDRHNYYQWYEIYVSELADMLKQIDDIQCEMFLMKISCDRNWSSIREEKFEHIPQNKFWEYVTAIKDTVMKYVKGEDGIPLLQLMEIQCI